MKKKILLLFILNLFLSQLSHAQNLAYIDIDYILNNSIPGKNIINKLEIINKENLKILKKEQETLNNERNEIEKKKNILSKKDLEIGITNINEKLKKFNQKQETLSNEFNNLRQKELINLINKINPIVEKYMMTNNIDLILKKDNVYIGKSVYDISDLIIEIINNSNLDK